MTAKNTKNSTKAAPEQQAGSKAGLFAGVVMLVALAAGGAYLTAKQNNSEAATADSSSVKAAAAATAEAGKDATAAAETAPAAGDKKADKAADKKDEKAADAGGINPADIKVGNPVVATVNGDEIKRSDVLNFIGGLPEQVRAMPLDKLFPAALEQVIDNKLVMEKSAKANLGGDPEVTKLMADAKVQIERNVFIEREVSKKVTEDKIKAAYKEALKNLKPVEETHAAQILVQDEKSAKDAIAALDKGDNWNDVVKKYTKGPNADNGGEIGWFAKTEMPSEEFANAAFALKKGEYSKTPVKTQFGYHVIKVEDRRMRPEPEYDAVKPQLEQQVRQKALADMVTAWQKEASIKKFDINGEPVKSN